MAQPQSNPDTGGAAPSARTMAQQEIRLVSGLLVLLALGLFLALPFVLSLGSAVFLPFAAGMFLSILLAPLGDRLVRLGLPAMPAALLALAGFIALQVIVVSAILQPALDTFDRAPQMAARVAARISELRGNLEWINDLNRQLARLGGRPGSREVVIASPSMVETLAFATPSFVLELVLTLLVTFFMTVSRIRMRRSLAADPAARPSSMRAAEILSAVQVRVSRYVVTVSAINLVVGLIVAIGAWALGLEAPIMWGGLAAVLNFLPYVGPLIMITVLGLFGLGTQDNALLGLLPPLLFLGLHAVESNLVTPAILGARFTMNPVLILFAISYFSWTWGIAGALLSIPILITLRALFEHIGSPNLIGFVFGEPLFRLPEAS